MMTLFEEGGAPMWFLAAFGIGMLIFAVRYATAPTRWAFRATLGLGSATLFTAVTGTCADLAAVSGAAKPRGDVTLQDGCRSPARARPESSVGLPRELVDRPVETRHRQAHLRTRKCDTGRRIR